MDEKHEVVSVPQLLKRAVKLKPNREALYDCTRRLTYQELDEESDRMAAALAAKGIRKGDHVAICLPNWHETVILIFAISKVGATLVPLNPKYREHEFKHILENSEPKLLFICDEVKDNINLDHVIPPSVELISVRFEAEGMPSFHNMMEHGKTLEVPKVDIDPENDNFSILYTSGTTGLPKGAIATHENATTGSIKVAQGLKCTFEDVYLITIPLFHVFGLGSCLISAISTHSKVVLLDKYSPVKTFQLIQDEKVSVRHAVPAMFNIELNHPEIENYDFSSLRVGLSGGAPIHRETLDGVREKMGMDVCGGFGLTEVYSITSTLLPDTDENIMYTIGKIMPGAGVKIVDENRKELPYGEVGEIVVRGFGKFKGYWKDPEKTKEAFDEDGWFYTGDLGTLDKDGYLRFKGRKKELIIRGGYNIFPQEIEGLLQKHDKVFATAVIGLPDPVMGEEVCAVIKLKEGMEATPEEFQEYLKDKVAKYKIPTKVIFVDEFPMTASGKIQKVNLRKEIINNLSIH